MLKNPYLSIIIPSYNEMNNLKRGVIDEVLAYLKKQTYNFELILADDGSTDGTVAELLKYQNKIPQIKVILNQHAGKGPTVAQGMKAAQGEWQLFTDFDQSTPIQEIEKLLKYQNNYDVIIGSREIKGAQRNKEPWHRHLMGKGFNFFVQLLTIKGLKDTQCGFKLFSQKASQTLFPKLLVYGKTNTQSDAFTGAFDVELLYLADKFSFRIKEVPITWRHFKTERVNPLKDSLRMFRDLFKIRIADLMGKYH